MKKTEKTALVAAAFAAALNIVPSSASAETPNNDPVREVLENQEDVYGPPSWFETTATGTTVLETTTRLSTLYGPPPVISVRRKGDFNYDGKVDAFDVVEARKSYFDDENSTYLPLDVNDDGEYNIADLLLVVKSSMGMDKEDAFVEEKSPVTTEEESPVTTTKEESPVTAISTTVQYLYGPPIWFETTTATTVNDDFVTTTVEETFAPLYGPPPEFID